MLDVREPPSAEAPDVDALFKEARRRQRRRRAALAMVALLFGGVIGTVVVTNDGGLSGQHGSAAARQSPTGVGTVRLRQPTALAVSRTGVLYVLDPARDQILRRLADGRFLVVAGSGRRGFSGDSGVAINAALDLNGDSDVVVAADGVVFFSDTGNGRVRAVLPNGRIETVAGDGRHIAARDDPPYLTGSRPALRSELFAPGGLAFGPGGKLYISAQDVVSVSSDGTLTYFAGPTRPGLSSEARLFDAYPNAIAFDRAGDMFVSSFPSLTERTAAGQIRFLGDGFRSDGGQGVLASTPEGTVLEGYGGGTGIVEQLVDPQPVPNGQLMSTRDAKRIVPADRLNSVLGSRNGIVNGFGPAGLAVGPDGTIYTDTDRGAWSSVSALVEINASGNLHELWRSP